MILDIFEGDLVEVGEDFNQLQEGQYVKVRWVDEEGGTLLVSWTSGIEYWGREFEETIPRSIVSGVWSNTMPR
jgi:hypothetical protein